MPELPTRVLTELRRTAVAAACLLPLCGLPASALGQGVPASLRACAAESDAGMRLDCYDREMKRLLAAPSEPSKSTAPAPAAKAASPAREPPSPQPDLSSSPAKPSAGTATPAAAAPKTAPGEAAAPHRASGWKIFGGSAASKVTAHVASLERSPDAMVLHLDNGQVWRQVGRVSGDLTLRAGDEVTIEKHLGSYWLSSRYVSGMRVRQEPE